MDQQPFIGVCIIVKDESHTIDGLLKSILTSDQNGRLPFDEYVFVDTGSTDDTREKISQAILKATGQETSWGIGQNSCEEHVLNTSRLGARPDPVRFVLAKFKWVDDFAAARNFSFDLSTAKWRCWLDGDDTLEQASQWRTKLELTEKNQPNVNCALMKYDYAPTMVQDKWRMLRWADGWRWEGEIHEEIVPYPPHQRVISVETGLRVKHQPTNKDVWASIDRNTKMCERIAEEAIKAGDIVKVGKMAYYLAQYAAIAGNFDKAKALYKDAGNALGITNLAAYAWTELAHLCIAKKLFHDAVKYAGRAIAACNVIPDGYCALGCALEEAGEVIRAADIFDYLWKMPQSPIQGNRDELWMKGWGPISAARAYLALSRLDDAKQALNRIPIELSYGPTGHTDLTIPVQRVASDYFKQVGIQKLAAYVDYLIWNNEPVKALDVLEDPPSNIEALPVISGLKKQIWDKMQQMKSWPDYKRVYAAETNEVYDRDEQNLDSILNQGRAQLALEWARRLPKEGPPFELYCVGIHGGWIEQSVLEANPRIKLTACDVNPNTNAAIQRLKGLFPNRIKFHQVVENHYDWVPLGRAGTFDAVFCFEVIEHPPDDHALLSIINTLLKPGGELLLSTPIAEYWVAPEAWQRHHWHQHVRAYQPHQLWKVLKQHGFNGDIYATDRRILHFAHVRKTHDEDSELEFLNRKTDRVSILVPSTPEPFDPESLKFGHVGGSEEAVIHLAPALSRLGFEVEVYGHIVDRDFKPHVVQDVCWRPVEEFDPARLDGTVLVWRNPARAAQLKKEAPHLRVLNWLHDAASGVSPNIYQQADGTIVLSKFHAEAIAKHDGFNGPFLFAQNGIDPTGFPEEGLVQRDPHLAIYASAPNRGLEFLLQAWPLIREDVPDAKLEIYYGWEITEQQMAKHPQLAAELGPLLDRLKRMIANLEPIGVTRVGGVDQRKLNFAYARAGVWTYPCGGPLDNFFEISCINAMRAQASGCVPVAFATGALPETLADSEFADLLDPKASSTTGSLRTVFADHVVKAMLHGPEEALRQTEAARAKERFTWDVAAEKFAKIIDQRPPAVLIDARNMRPFDGLSLHEPGGPMNIGGSEEAVILLAKGLALKGTEVTVLHPEVRHENHGLFKDGDGVQWTSTEPVRDSTSNTVWIIARDPEKANANPEAISWLMDPTYGVSHNSRFKVALTKAHVEVLRGTDGTDSKNQGWKVIGLGLDPTELPPLSEQNDQGRHPEWVMWASSPDRGLAHLLRMWPAVKEQVPNAQLHIYYGMAACLQRASQDPDYAKKYGIDQIDEFLRDIIKCRDLGVYYHGSTPRTEFIAAHVRCGTLAYTNDQFTETFCMTAVRAQACGMWPVLIEAGSLPEVVDGDFVTPGQWGAFEKILITAMRTPPSFARRKRLAIETLERFSLERMASDWLRLIEQVRLEASTPQVGVVGNLSAAAPGWSSSLERANANS